MTAEKLIGTAILPKEFPIINVQKANNLITQHSLWKFSPVDFYSQNTHGLDFKGNDAFGVWKRTTKLCPRNLNEQRGLKWASLYLLNNE